MSDPHILRAARDKADAAAGDAPAYQGPGARCRGAVQLIGPLTGPPPRWRGSAPYRDGHPPRAARSTAARAAGLASLRPRKARARAASMRAIAASAACPTSCS